MAHVGAMPAPRTIGRIGKTYGLQTGLATTCVINLLGMVTLFLAGHADKRYA